MFESLRCWLVIIATLFTITSAQYDPQDRINFLTYTAKYGKSYDSTAEFRQRFANWKEIDGIIKQQSV
jgi:hypothetical protein